jgi:uncharacterized membrane-anchored protein
MAKARIAFAFLFACFLISPCFSQGAPPPAAASPAVEPKVDPQREAENKQIDAAAKLGPVDITLHDEAVLSVPKGKVFLPAKEASLLMLRMGNITGESFLGMVLSQTGENWFVVADFDDSGYVKDEEGKDIDADKLLQSMKDGQEEENKVRVERGMDPLRITRWIERPHYDQVSRHLVWSIELQTLDAKGNVKDTNLNYNTYALGRGGFITLKLVTGVDTVEKDKAHVRELLSNLKFKPGKRYEDFNASTDKVAAYGLLALIGGVAVKKLGFLAMIGVFLAKFAKVIIGGAVVAFAAFRKFFRRKDDAETAVAEPAAASTTTNDPPTV